MFCTTCGTAMTGSAPCPACGAAPPRGPGQVQEPVPGQGGPSDQPTLVSTPVRSTIGSPSGPAVGEIVASGSGEDPAHPEPEGSGRRNAVIAIVAVIAVLAVGIGAFLVLGKDSDDKGRVESGASPLGDEGTSTTRATSSTTSTTEATTTTLPETIPKLVGMTLDEAKERIDGLGVDLKVVNVADEKNPSGTILKQTPEAGTPFDDVITVNVARPPVKTYLDQLAAVEQTNGGIEGSGTATLNTTVYTRSSWMQTCRYFLGGEVEQQSVGYDLGRGYSRFVSVVGVDDGALSGATARFQVYGDGRLLGQADGGLGAPATIDVDTTGVLRLTIMATGLACEQHRGNVSGVWADPYLVSAPPSD